MTADDMVPIRVVFRPGPSQTVPVNEEYRISSSELGRLIADLCAPVDSRIPQPPFYSYDVSLKGVRRKLVIRPSDLLYIG